MSVFCAGELEFCLQAAPVFVGIEWGSGMWARVVRLRYVNDFIENVCLRTGRQGDSDVRAVERPTKKG